MKFTLIPQTEELFKIYETRRENLSNRGDSGLDLVTPEDVLVPANEKVLLDLKVKAQLTSKVYPLRFCLKKCPLRFSSSKKYHSYILMPRSSIATATPLMMLNSIGLIDSGYTGNLKVPLINVSNQDFTIPKGSRLVQLITPNLEPIKTFKLKTKEEFDRVTERGEGGFGSTSTKQ
jgi:dUTP pyrophosphatase